MEDETTREMLAEVMRMGPKDWRSLLDIARQNASLGEDG
jgi:hypothetical protein